MHSDLLLSLKNGFIDREIHSNNNFIPKLLVNDASSGRKVLTTINQELRTCDEFILSVAFVTTSGVATLINTLISLEDKKIKGKVLVSQYLNFTQPEALKRLLRFKNIELKIATNNNFHAKGYLFRHCNIYSIIIGSSNLTANALCSNTEWNLKISATDQSSIVFQSFLEFENEFRKAIPVDEHFILDYENEYQKLLQISKEVNVYPSSISQTRIKPNAMQLEALHNISLLRSKDKKQALIISATGTGKTFLSAFDVMKFNPKKFLFVVHRSNIAKAAMNAYRQIFGDTKSMGLFSGDQKEVEKDFIFSTIQTISKKENLDKFAPNYFDYIVLDESHRAGAESYLRLLEHFTPKFLLGMTATPERTDGLDIFKLFNYNIAYEIRLHKALEEEMLSPFHYYGVADITVNGCILNEKSDFSHLTSSERIKHIIEKAKLYSSDDGNVRGLVFCSRIEECFQLSKDFNKLGYKTIALSGKNTESERSQAISLLESDFLDKKIDYIFTVDIFNEGIDIPRVNQIIMLRPTQSAIIFVQQLGRGLRKIANKEYLTVIDFIGNYKNNFMVPIALYADTSYNKDTLRKLMYSGSSLIPGTSTINFDKISESHIYSAIDAAKMTLKRDLVNDYKLLKFKLGRIPMMVDFINHGSRDPQLYVNYAKSYFNFIADIEEGYINKLKSDQRKLLELFSKDINDSKRVEENIILKEIINHGSVSKNRIKSIIKQKYQYIIDDRTISSCISNLNFEFVTENKNKKLRTIREIYGTRIVIEQDSQIRQDPEFKMNCENSVFLQFLNDSLNYSINMFDSQYSRSKFFGGFILYRKYSRKDVFRILNWEKNPLAQNVGWYIISSDKTNCPIFVNYHKDENITETSKYEDRFIDPTIFEWMSKSKRTLESPDVKTLINYKEHGLRMPLFVKKSNDEGKDFYYMGDVTPLENSFEQAFIPDGKGKKVSLVKVRFSMNNPVEENIYSYITEKNNFNAI